MISGQTEIAELYIAGVNLPKVAEYTYSTIVRLKNTQKKIQVVSNRDRHIKRNSEGRIKRVIW